MIARHKKSFAGNAARAEAGKRQVVFINRFFYPDQSATSQIVSDLAFTLAEQEFGVMVIASRRHENGVDKSTAGTIRGVSVSRVSIPDLARLGLFGRLVEYGLFYLLGSAALWRHVRRGDVVVAKTDPPLIAVGAALVARIRGASLVNWLQDIYPEVAIRLGVPGVRGPLGALLAKLRNLALKSAVINVAIGERMREFIADRGVDGATIRVIANWVDDQAITPIPRADNPLRASLGLQDHFVVGYSGNLGRAHEFETLLGAAHLLRAETRLAFLFFGGGFHMDALKARVRDQGLSELFMFQPSQPLSDLSNSLSLPDVHWLSLRPQLEGLIVPSKFYGIAAAGRPVLSITAEDGEIARIVQEAECGVVVEPGRSSALAAAIQRLRADRPRCDEMGRNARALIDARFSRRQTLESWSKLLRDV